ncbi:alpha/beta hydrolase [Steroidobacter sp.]|uniref:alpha/beta hydrolase n=1 Tax=Steroidobacter sp. TaxID=1978227 RepID=UPI001A4C52B6|nr:alpha/beta hydrolase-fold protein [Steroidobacter sp.]MBL8268883.1 alpha/beta hydrolase [Steroidobacter sp.]
MFASRRGFLGMAGMLGLSARAWSADKPSAAHVSPAKPWQLYRSESFTLKWREREFLIGIARPLDIEPDLPLMLRGYKPVPIYVTDANENFPIVAATCRQMQWGGEVPPCVVVGIDYLDADLAMKEDWRRRELTPTAQPRGLAGKSKLPSGMAAEFRSFIVDTVRPIIEQRFDVDRERSMLIGHSFGGLFTLDTMLNRPEAFGNYLALSPSLWWDQELVLRSFKDKLAAGTVFKSRAVALAGEQEERISPPETHMTSNTLEFGRLVADNRRSFPNGAWVSVLPRTTHHTIVASGVAQGMRYLIAPDERRSETF